MPPHWSYEETSDPRHADRRNFYKVEQWSRDDMHIARLHYAGNSIVRARAEFARLTRHRPRGRYTIRQGIRVLERWPPR